MVFTVNGCSLILRVACFEGSLRMLWIVVWIAVMVCWCSLKFLLVVFNGLKRF